VCEGDVFRRVKDACPRCVAERAIESTKGERGSVMESPWKSLLRSNDFAKILRCYVTREDSNGGPRAERGDTVFFRLISMSILLFNSWQKWLAAVTPGYRHDCVCHPLLIADREGNSPTRGSSDPRNGLKDLPEDLPIPMEVVTDGSRSSRNGAGVAKCRVWLIASQASRRVRRRRFDE
jgi:hypothetical protein